MAGRPRTQLTRERRAALAAELVLYRDRIHQAEKDLRVHMSRANAAGMTYREIGDALGVSHNTARLWSTEGDQARDERRGDTGEPGEHPSPD